MERPRINLSFDGLVRAYKNGELPWTLHKSCEYTSDPGQWGASAINNAEIMLACLTAAEAKSVVEVGAYAGDMTRVLLGWGKEHGARVSAIDPSPQDELVALAEGDPDLELIRATSHEALRELPRHDALFIDGDHNYYTVSEELRLVQEASADGPFPLLLFHDVAWPHARRDDYFNPDLIPEEYRQATKEGGGLFPGIKGTTPGGLPYKWPAAEEGGPRNGVLTAIEDFVEANEGLRLAIVPAFFGLGVVWHTSAPYSDKLEALVGPLDRHPVLARLEYNRVFHLASVHTQLMEVAVANDRIYRQRQVLERLLTSSAFSLAERLSRLRVRAGVAPGSAVVSKEMVREALGDRQNGHH